MRFDADALLAPTRLYVAPALAALAAAPRAIGALAHITGGGLVENLPRVLPPGLGARLDLASWPLPPAFAWIAGAGGVTREEMARTFNCGVGMAAVVAAAAADEAAAAFAAAGETVWRIGAVTEAPGVALHGAAPP